MHGQNCNNLKITLAQYNPIVGDIDGNSLIIKKAYQEACESDSDLIVFSELFLTGYPPEDLILKPSFIRYAMDKANELCALTQNMKCAILLGMPWNDGASLFNSVVLMEAGKVSSVRHKVELPNYGVFDEKRVFSAGDLQSPINFKGISIGVPICEDIWKEEVCECLQETGAEILIVPNGSPFTHNKYNQRMNVAVSRITETKLPMVYVNQFGGQDELVFDGSSFVLNSDNTLKVQLPSWQNAQLTTEWSKINGDWQCNTSDLHLLKEGLDATYSACVIGLRDYVNKNGFPGVVIGLSGGIDSALCAAIAVDALGSDKVHCIMLPYKYTSDESLEDAEKCATSLKVKYDIVDISQPVSGFLSCLSPLFKDSKADITEENIQSRARGVILMAISNKFGKMVVTTGNKSEVSVGYATLYGDMNGGYNPIKDIYKTEVYALARYRNSNLPEIALGPPGEVIPLNIINKAPTAELREGQKDQDTLPAYDILDDILKGFVESEMSAQDIISQGYDLETVRKIEHLLYIAEYKRRQSAPGVKISEKNFGRDRRYPIVNKFRE